MIKCCPYVQGLSEVCGIRDQRGGIKDQKDGIWDHSPGPRDLTPWDRNQQSFRDQGSGCTIFVGSGTKMGPAFGIKDQKYASKNGISKEKTYLVTTLLCCSLTV